jgi:hypothetical protein
MIAFHPDYVAILVLKSTELRINRPTYYTRFLTRRIL